jgi:hypothetical protein
VQEVKASKLGQKIAELTETIVFDPNTMMPGAKHPSLNYNAMVLALPLFLSSPSLPPLLSLGAGRRGDRWGAWAARFQRAGPVGAAGARAGPPPYPSY